MHWCHLKMRNGANMKMCTVVLVIVAGMGKKTSGDGMPVWG